MARFLCLLAAAATAVAALAADSECKPNAPCYTAATVVNAASGEPGALSPNALASIYGSQLSFTERAIQASDIQGDQLPVLLPGSGVRVFVGGALGGTPVPLYYVSPGQVNFLIPSDIRPGELVLQLVRDGTVGPSARVTLRPAAAALFQLDDTHVVASHLDYSLVSEKAPARPGEWVILWATGLGEVTPPAIPGGIPKQPASLQALQNFRILLDGVALDPARVGYAGLAPGWGGLYQINLRLPEAVGQNPEIRLAAGDSTSRAGLRLWAKPDGP